MVIGTPKTLQNPFSTQNGLWCSVLGIQWNLCFVLCMDLSSSRMLAMVRSPFLLQKRKMRKISRWRLMMRYGFNLYWYIPYILFFKKKTALLRWLTYNKRHVFKVYYLVHFVLCLYLWNCRDKIMSVSVTPTSFFVPLWNPFLHSPPFSLPSLSLLDNHWCASRHYRWVCTF